MTIEERFALPSRATASTSTPAIGLNRPSISVATLGGAVVTLAIMLTLKRYYSLATAGQLNWILAPTARLVAWLTTAHPVYEYGVGYVDFSQGIIVAPACAGINFMIMVFGMAAFCGLMQTNRIPGLVFWLTTALVGAYGYTLVVNTLRIGVSMVLYRADFYGGWLTMARLHRLAGIGIYIGALWLFFSGLQTIISRYGNRLPWAACKNRRSLPGWLPFGWYGAGAVGVPLANLLFQQAAPSLFEYCLTIVITVIFVATLNWAAQTVASHLRQHLKAEE